jgi:hypothetical protein
MRTRRDLITTPSFHFRNWISPRIQRLGVTIWHVPWIVKLVNHGVVVWCPGYEAILCRHALFHNTVDAIKAILRAVSTSDAKWFLATTLRPIDDACPSPLSEVPRSRGGTVHDYFISDL